MHIRKAFWLAFIAILSWGVAHMAFAQGYPAKAIRVIVPFAAGGANDLVARALQRPLGRILGGTLVVEQVFALPGIGQLMINSIFQRDFPVVQAVTLAFAVMVVLVYLTTDIIHALLDPRVRFD